MQLFETIAVAFSMYSAIPMPQFAWNDKNMKYALCAFPLIGIIIGLLQWLAMAGSLALELPDLLRGAILCLIPVLVTGGIHLDGYADTGDALASHADAEKKQEILKDPHIGSFAVIRLLSYFVISFALWTAMGVQSLLTLILIYCLSRSLSGLAVTTFKPSKKSGLAYMFSQAADKKRASLILGIMAVLYMLGLVFAAGLSGIAAAGAALIVYAYYYHTAMKQFGGLSGDLAGWFLQKCEFWMAAALYAAGLLLNIFG